MELYIGVWGSVTNWGTTWMLNLSQFLEAHLVKLVVFFVARWKMTCRWANTSTANCHHSQGRGLWVRQKDSTVLPPHNYSQLNLAQPFWDIGAAQFLTTHLSTLSKCYINYLFTNQGEKHARRQLWAVQKMGWKEIGFVLQYLFKEIKIPFHLIRCCLKSCAESIHHMVSNDLWSSNRNVI